MVEVGYVQDDTVKTPEYLLKMSKQELKDYITKLEKEIFISKKNDNKKWIWYNSYLSTLLSQGAFLMQIITIKSFI